MPSGHNPLCGDQLTVFVRLDGERVADIRFEGTGCAISTASASLMTEAVKGKDRTDHRQPLRARCTTLLTQQDARGGCRPRQARRALGRARVPGAREVREPVLAHPQCRPERGRGNRLDRVAEVTMRRTENEPFVVNREVKAVIVPAGQEVNLKPGQAGYITQALGGSFTLYIDGNLFRLSGEDADAIGQEAVERAGAAAQRRRGGCEEARLGADAHLLRPGDPDQHRRPGPGLRVRRDRPTRTARARWKSRSHSPPRAAAWATSWWMTCATRSSASPR